MPRRRHLVKIMRSITATPDDEAGAAQPVPENSNILPTLPTNPQDEIAVPSSLPPPTAPITPQPPIQKPSEVKSMPERIFEKIEMDRGRLCFRIKKLVPQNLPVQKEEEVESSSSISPCSSKNDAARKKTQLVKTKENVVMNEEDKGHKVRDNPSVESDNEPSSSKKSGEFSKLQQKVGSVPETFPSTSSKDKSGSKRKQSSSLTEKPKRSRNQDIEKASSSGSLQGTSPHKFPSVSPLMELFNFQMQALLPGPQLSLGQVQLQNPAPRWDFIQNPISPQGHNQTRPQNVNRPQLPAQTTPPQRRERRSQNRNPAVSPSLDVLMQNITVPVPSWLVELQRDWRSRPGRGRARDEGVTLRDDDLDVLVIDVDPSDEIKMPSPFIPIGHGT